MKSTILWDIKVTDVSEEHTAYILRVKLPQECWLTFNGLHSIISQKIVLFRVQDISQLCIIISGVIPEVILSEKYYISVVNSQWL
jgi:hypothetical protein